VTEVPAISVDALSHRYGEREALRSLSFEVAQRTSFALLGPNGGGKTTLFRILSTLIRPRRGTVRVLGHDVARQPGEARRHLGVVFQAAALDHRLTVVENLRHHGHLYGLRGTELAARSAEALAALSLSERARDIVGDLSGGLKRRVEIAKILLSRPKVLLLDEPSTGLDPGARRELWAELARLRERTAATLVITTHLTEEAAGCDRVGILHDGRLVAIGTPANLTATVGGDVLWITPVSDPAALAARLGDRFGVRPDVVDGRVRLERARGHEFVTDLIEAFPGEIDAVTLSRPTLEDVFVHHTGHLFD
jgi:ABC-2 type transport system ATP-binding protein